MTEHNDMSIEGHPAGKKALPPLVTINSDLLADVAVTLEARLGTGTIQIKDLLALKAGSSVVLETPLNGVVDVLLNSALIARGEVVAVGDHYAIRITAIAAPVP